jgi:hypothetical protein
MTSVKGSNSNWENDILEQMDSYAKEYDFPMLNNIYFHNADVRLTAFRDSSEWLIVFEEIALSKKQYSFINSVSAYGNKIEKPGPQQAITIIAESPGKPIWEDNRNFLLDQWNFEVVINGEIKRFTPSPEDYNKAKIDVESNMEVSAKILRLLTFIIPNEFFMSADRLIEICARTNSNLENFIQIEDWYHPDIADDELPSQSECFQNLALAIARNDQDLYTCPEESINTHWSNWAEE